MQNKGLVFGASFLAGTLIFAEIADGIDWQGRADYPLGSTLMATLPPAVPQNPHNHTEASVQFLDVSSPYFASGGQHVVGGYVLNLKPHISENSEGQRIVLWVDAVGLPDGLSGEQCLFARFCTIDELASALTDKLGLSAVHVASIRRDVSRGLTQIGGTHPGIRFFFSETQLIEFGMSFRPLDG